MAAPAKKYWAVRYRSDPRYRVTLVRFGTPSEASQHLYSMPFRSDQMLAVPFGRMWQNMSWSEKAAIEEKLEL